MSRWFRKLAFVVFGLLLSMLPLELRWGAPASEDPPPATWAADEGARAPGGDSVRLCVQGSVVPPDLSVRIRNQSGDGHVKTNCNDPLLALCIGTAPEDPGEGRPTADD